MEIEVGNAFRSQVIEAAIEPRCLVRRKWLDFETREIEWNMWETHFIAALERRGARCAPELPEQEAELLVILLEAIALHVARSGSYIGNIELQIITHSMISYCFTSTYGGSWSERFCSSIAEIARTRDDSRFARVLLEISRRVSNMHSPIINSEFLCYPIGTVIGVDLPVNY